MATSRNWWVVRPAAWAPTGRNARTARKTFTAFLTPRDRNTSFIIAAIVVCLQPRNDRPIIPSGRDARCDKGLAINFTIDGCFGVRSAVVPGNTYPAGMIAVREAYESHNMPRQLIPVDRARNSKVICPFQRVEIEGVAGLRVRKCKSAASQSQIAAAQ